MPGHRISVQLSINLLIVGGTNGQRDASKLFGVIMTADKLTALLRNWSSSRAVSCSA